MPSTLYSHLSKAYGVFCANRSGGGPGTCSLKIDDRNERNDRDRYRWFCTIRATFRDLEADSFDLVLHYAPCGSEIGRLIEHRGGQIERHGLTAHLTVTLISGDSPFIRQLAKAIQGLTGPGRRYPNPSWAWICPRTAFYLGRLATHLAAYSMSAAAATRR